VSRTGTARDSLRLALGTLTAVRVAPPSRVDRTVAGLAMALAPLVAVVPAAVAGVAVAVGSSLGAPPLLVGVLAVGALALTTRGLHLDGLADTVDGLASGHDRERALGVMRTGDVGPLGAAALTLVLVGQAAAVSGLVAQDVWVAAASVATCVLLSRSMLAIACAAGVPAARPDGLGAAVAGTVRRPVTVVVVALATVPVCAACALGDRPWWLGVVAAVASAATTGALVARCTSRLGGITGDVLGAVVELSLLVSWAVLSLGR
jgi:adenosylcobinamide-GDP ribazoletransferase